MKVDESKAEFRNDMPGMSSLWLTNAVFKPNQISRDELKLPMFQQVIEHLIADKIMARRFSADGCD